MLFILVQNEAENNVENINQDRVRLKQCKYLLKQALDIDESGREDLAIDTYTQAIELSLKVVGRQIFYSYNFVFNTNYVIKFIILMCYIIKMDNRRDVVILF